MSGAQTKTHWLPGNKGEWTPPTVIFLDTETRSSLSNESGRRMIAEWRELLQNGQIIAGPTEYLSLRLWVASLIDRRLVKGSACQRYLGYGTTHETLATWINEQFVGRRTIWLYAHNLNFDAVTTKLPENMLKLGWELTKFSTFGKSPWFKFKRGTRSLTVTDSWSWLPKALSDIGTAIGHEKSEWPGDDASDEDILRYCCRDVEVLQRAMLELMQWWDDNHLGYWSHSGAACGYNAMRHMCQTRQILIDPDNDAREFERKAIYGGRRDATRHGKVIGGPFAHIDFTMAYATIAANCLSPCKRFSRFESIEIDNRWLDHQSWGCVAEVEIDTNQPYYPCRLGSDNIYPTGRFRTVLCSPEILEARRRGHLVSIGAGYWHMLGPTLLPWGKWIIGCATGEVPDVPYTARLACKAWSRSALGKFAAHSGTERPWGESDQTDFTVQEAWSVARHKRAVIIDTGKERKLVTADEESDNSYPLVFAWFESETRVRLNRILEYLGEEAWVQCDTDGAIMDIRRSNYTSHDHAFLAKVTGNPEIDAEQLCEGLAEITWPLKARLKEMYSSVEIVGPQQVFLGTKYKLSGIPNKSERIFPRLFCGTVWPKYASQSSIPGQVGFRLEHKVWTVTECTIHRFVCVDGSTVPIDLTLDDQGSNAVVSYPTRDFVGTAREPIMLQWEPIRKYL